MHMHQPCNNLYVHTFQIRNLKRKHKDHVKDCEKTVYYSDFVPFAHDPPGHTCGLPCCNNDLYIRLKVSGHHAGCMSMPFQNSATEDAGENFTLRRNQLHLLKGKPTFKNGGFYSMQQHRSEQRKAVPSFASLPRNSSEQRHFLQGRGITLPRIDLANSSSDAMRGRHRIESDDTDSSSESDYQPLGKIEKRRITQKRCDSDMPQLPRIHPMELLKARRKFGIADIDNEDSSSSNDESNYYNEIVMSNFRLRESDAHENAKTNTLSESLDDVFLPTKQPTYHTLSLDKTFMFDSKRNTFERMTGREKYPDLSKCEAVNQRNSPAMDVSQNEINRKEINTGRKSTSYQESTSDTSVAPSPCRKPSHVPLKSALKTRSLQHDPMRKSVLYTQRTASLGRHEKCLNGCENRGFVDDNGMSAGDKRYVDARPNYSLETINESPITLIL